MNTSGWFKLHRSVLDNCVVCKDADHLALWVYILGLAAFEPHDTFFNGKKITLQAGQFVTGRNVLAKALGINRSKIERILSLFESEQQIEQLTTPNGRLISVKNWSKYQLDEQVSEQRLSNERATTEQRLSTTKEIKNERKKEYKNTYGEFKNVKLSEAELEKLKAEYGEEKTQKAITFLDDYIERKGYKAKSHYLTMRKWVFKAVEEEEQKKPRNEYRASAQQQNYDFAEIERLLVGRGQE